MTVLLPTITASWLARRTWARSRASGPVIHWLSPAWVAIRPSSVVANFRVTSGRPSRMRKRKPALTSDASSAHRPVSTTRPAPRSLAIPRPETRGSGSSMGMTMRARPAAIRASVHGGVLPQWQHGSRLTKAVASRAAAPARVSASVSPWGRPPGCVQPRPTTRPPLTMTQPTVGLGQTSPSPRRAKAIAARIWASSVSTTGSIAVGVDPADELTEVLGLTEVPVDRCEADIGNLVEAGKRLHDEPPDDVAWYLALPRTLELTDHRIDDAFDLFRLDRALAQGDVDRTGQLVALEGFALPVLLDHRQLAELHALEGGEPGGAVRTETPSADGRAIIGRSRVLDLGVLKAAKRTAHRLLSPDTHPLSVRSYGSRASPSISVDRKAGTQILHLATHARFRIMCFGALRHRVENLDDERTHLAEFRLAEAARRRRRRAEADARGYRRLFRIEGNAVLVASDAGPLEGVLNIA